MMQAWIDRLEKQQSSDIQGLQSTIKEMIEERMSAVEEKIEGLLGTMEEKIEGMKSRCFPLVLTSTINVGGTFVVNHISVVSPDKLWVSNRRKLQQLDDTGHVIRTLDDEYQYDNDGGGHTVSVEGDLVFIAKVHNSVQPTASDGLESQKIYYIRKITSDGSITTLLTLDVPDLSPRCIHSSHINGDLLIGLTADYSYSWPGRVMRCDKTGKKIGDIELDEEGERLYKGPRYITENKINGDIVVSDDWREALVVVDRSGRHRFDYKGHSTDQSFQPHGVCTDVLGRILVVHTGTDNDWRDVCCISLLDHDGRFLTRLLTEPADLGDFVPRSLCVDDKNNIYVAYDDKIKVFR
uniref:Uncharacterized protein LOC111112648 n=1 Tax=Crassostrea virginica TaxID=6565 RepID=A0A8B8BRQ1_CRAVI|nr:uncharacterized protein LOC111112648 [Crassostrea virginica]